MDYRNKRKKFRFISKSHLFIFFVFFFSLFISTTISSSITICPDIMSCSLSAKVGGTYFQQASRRAEGRKLRGLGSSPPRCQWKCGKCTPCNAVHVPVPPGNPVTAEYYPEAWRCKCGNKFYMP